MYAGILGPKTAIGCAIDAMIFFAQVLCQDGKPYSQGLGVLLAGYLP